MILLWKGCEFMKKKVLGLLLSTILICSACTKSYTFDDIMSKCVDVTGYEIYTEGVDSSHHEEGEIYYFPNGTEKSDDRSMYINGFVGIREYDFRYAAKKAFEPETPKEPVTTAMMGNESLTVYDENVKDGYIIEYRNIYPDVGVTREGHFSAYYLVGNCTLYFDFYIIDGEDKKEGREEYDMYLKLCEDLGLYTNSEVMAYVEQFSYGT